MATGRQKDKMINFFPEDLGSQFAEVNNNARRSPCWLPGSKPTGLLDALSKHFMLAQGIGTTIDQFMRASWSETEVAYAGEITVDPSRCTFSLNNNSGTYRPEDQSLQNVIEFFLKELGRNSITLSGIGKWC